MAGGPILCTLPALKENGKEETHEEVPRAEPKRLRRIFSRLFKKKRVREQEKGHSMQRRNPEHFRESLQEEKEATHDESFVQAGHPVTNRFRRLQPELEMEAEAAPRVSPRSEWIHINVRCKIHTAEALWATGRLSIPPSATYKECIAETCKALRKHSVVENFPCRFLVNGMRVDWHTGLDTARALPREVHEDNFQGCLLSYSRYIQRVVEEHGHVIFEPVSMELILSGMELPSTS
ncbi:MAG: hypothetical protein LQ348_006722 [Seirophora lacunosa]|nr:MAG: hypothetical protein LQ344_000886 [Seirophora lacunosa]KAI4172705.1 MAG: hypothetical protein LQ348_006722 [Seirophora lacunosa]